ncbi:hypothetical protein VZT92_003088 [Zoarces viviparus]|uniref:Uncharacterized protein n=1 Tax=Zoarces viviparus TaxID=48416 RepID=A0AAW1G2T2_ZOAVI
MWQLLARRSSRKRGGHRLPLRAVTVSIVFCRLLAAGPSARSGDPSGLQIPGFIKAGLTASVSACAFAADATLTDENKSGQGEERASAPLPPGEVTLKSSGSSPPSLPTSSPRSPTPQLRCAKNSAGSGRKK